MNNQEYWENRLKNNLHNLEGVGFTGLGNNYNQWMYRERKRIFKKQLKKLNINFKKASILEVGSGTGFYTKILQNLGAKNYIGSDITSAVVNKLSIEFDDFIFYKQDIGSDLINELSSHKFDFIFAIDILFHITDDERYQQAFINISNLLSERGVFMFTENLPNDDFYRETFVVRSNEKLMNFLKKASLEVIDIVPMTIFLNNPLNKNKFNEWVYKLQNKILFRYPSKAYKERAGNVLGFIFYWIDWLLLPYIIQGPSNHMIICRIR